MVDGATPVLLALLLLFIIPKDPKTLLQGQFDPNGEMNVLAIYFFNLVKTVVSRLRNIVIKFQVPIFF